MLKRKTLPFADSLKTDTIAKAFVAESCARGARALFAAHEGKMAMEKLAQQWRNTGDAQVGGRLAEAWHATTFNVDAALQGRRDLSALTTAANGQGTATADIQILQSGRTVSEAQLKYCQNPTHTTFEISHSKYDGMQRVVPSDQVEQVKHLAERRGIDELGVRNYPETAETVSDRIHYDGVESRPLSSEEAHSLTDQAKNGQAADALIRETSLQQAKKAALLGAAVGGGISAIRHSKAWFDGDLDACEATVEVLKDTGKSALSGAVSSVVITASQQTLLKAGAQSLARGSAPVAIGMTVLEIGKDAYTLAKGNKDTEEFAISAGKHIVKGGMLWGGMEAGATLGTMIAPGVGTIIGGAIGGIGAGLLGSLLDD